MKKKRRRKSVWILSIECDFGLIFIWIFGDRTPFPSQSSDVFKQIYEQRRSNKHLKDLASRAKQVKWNKKKMKKKTHPESTQIEMNLCVRYFFFFVYHYKRIFLCLCHSHAKVKLKRDKKNEPWIMILSKT